jgi:hypothetical protein
MVVNFAVMRDGYVGVLTLGLGHRRAQSGDSRSERDEAERPPEAGARGARQRQQEARRGSSPVPKPSAAPPATGPTSTEYSQPDPTLDFTSERFDARKALYVKDLPVPYPKV